MPAIRSSRSSRPRPAPSPSPPPDTDPSPTQHDFNFNQAVYDKVRQIPEGKVASYGDIARLIGFPKHSRMVGNALKVLPRHLATPTLPQAAPGPRPARPATDEGDLSDEQPAASASAIEPLFAPATDDEAEGDQPDDDVLPEPEPNPDFVPWHRVLAASGVISPRGSLAAVMRQADYLRAEGVEVAGAPEQGDGRVGHGVLGQGGVDGGRVSMAMYRWDGEE